MAHQSMEATIALISSVMLT
ncbi:hypothetical protein RvY_05574 [Ramazzottius varieornatus]|uniref:Uncharacterized protein n=1 Tax=Ramazzottius varieornatus TaxID=947166 RepID=A0A1D1UVI0_RAMVA|nr:hypothetical protein RvY_05574 [Ramazzottius varieornatus]